MLYPGLPEHPGYKINKAQARGAGSMISFRVDSKKTALRVLARVRLITFTESLGGTEFLLIYPAIQTHPDVSLEMRERLGIMDTLLRLMDMGRTANHGNHLCKARCVCGFRRDTL